MHILTLYSFLFLVVFFLCVFVQYLLDFASFKLRDSNGNPLPRQPFDVKSAAKMFKRYVRPNENLLKAKLVCFLI
jgi:hypothetical protein